MKLAASIFCLLGFWVFEPSHYATHRAAQVGREQRSPAFCPCWAPSQQPALTGQPWEWATLQVDPQLPGSLSWCHMEQRQAFPTKACPNCSFMSYIIDCRLKPLGLTHLSFLSSKVLLWIYTYFMANFLVLRWEPILVSCIYIMPDFSNSYLIIVRAFCRSSQIR